MDPLYIKSQSDPPGGGLHKALNREDKNIVASSKNWGECLEGKVSSI